MKEKERERKKSGAILSERNNARGRKGTDSAVEGDGKPEAQLRPSFSAALPIYILRRIYRRMCMFLISWMHKPRARIDAPMRLARRTFSDARIALSSTSTSSLFTPARFLVARSRSPPSPPRFLSFLHKSAIFYSLFLSFSSLLPFLSLCTSFSLFLHTSSISLASFPRDFSFPRLLTS